jgi:hypothetical protein
MLLGVDLDMGMQDLIRSDAHHTLAVLNFVPKFSFFFYVFQLQRPISRLKKRANKKRPPRKTAPEILCLLS